MKTLNKRILFVIISLLLVSNVSFAQTQAKPVVFADNNIKSIYQDYAKLDAALVKGDAAAVKAAATALASSLKLVPEAKSIAGKASQIVLSKEVKEQHVYFAGISIDVIALVMKSGLKSGELYVTHCPMALDHKGAYWLSGSKEINNPYFGKMMLRCGSVEETIK